MGLYPKIQAYDGGLEVVDVFRGLNRAEKISEGEWSEELNLTTDRFPMLSVRKQRTTLFSNRDYQATDMTHLGGNVYIAAIPDRSSAQTWQGIMKLFKNGVEVATFNYDSETIEPYEFGVGAIRFLKFGSYLLLPKIKAWYNTADGTSGTIAEMPDMDFVIECQNRLWGCYYGVKEVEENGETVEKIVNEIYASELGKFDSWSNYDGTSMAAYAASVGTDGKWTGAVSFQGKPYFFKEKHVHKVYISATGAHQIVDEPILGVLRGCSKSLYVLNGALYYMSRDGVCRYDGSTPVVISEELGSFIADDAVFSGYAQKLYAVFNIDTPLAHSDYAGLYVYDTERGLWHRESIDIEFPVFAEGEDGVGLWACSTNEMTDIEVVDVTGTASGTEETVSYSCTSGLIGWQNIEQKYISRFDLRLTLPQGATMKVELEYDSSGTWIEQGTVHGGGTGSVVIPVRPRRCDHFRLRLSGTGEMRMYSWAKRLTKGSDVVL